MSSLQINGTIKLRSMEDLLRLYNLKKDVDDYTGNKMEEHYEEEEDDQEDKNGHYIYRRRNCNQAGTSMTTTRLFTVNGYANFVTGYEQYDYGLIVTSQMQRSPSWASFGYNDPWNDRGFDYFYFHIQIVHTKYTKISTFPVIRK